jgi:DNA replication protein DnaC
MADKELMEAQERLKKKQAERKATGNPTQSTSSEFGDVLERVMTIAEERKDETPDIEVCKHNRAGYCRDCYDEDSYNSYSGRKKESYKKQQGDMRESLGWFGVPKKYQNCSFESYSEKTGKYKAECQKYQSGGLVLTGNTGCGKTHLAVAIMRQFHYNNLQELIEREWVQGQSGDYSQKGFVSIPDLLLEIRMTYDKKSELSEADIIEKYTSVPFLILDDLGSEKTSEFSITTLYLIIDRRDREEMSTIITTNLTNEEIEKTMNARIASRMAGMKNIKINMDDYRKKR